ncbi:LemA family protein [Capnocytophaga leadbetteri]|uniref:LemA family protein n=1 Tax=Capnocytophaga leadbetteri TaxID=327575 RepID=UPI0028E4D7C9|nr:LemA family protein [Capnocytophaga leadbetteri]
MMYMIIGAVVVLLLLYIAGVFNGINKRRNQIENAISSLDALFIQRAELIPNLIETAKQYMAFEKETLTKIAELRKPINLSDITESDNPYAGTDSTGVALKAFMLQAEAYPELESNQQFNYLQRQLTECEEQLSAGRRFLSASITDYNDAIVVFPKNLIANAFGFKKYQWQYATTEQRKAVDAKALFNN